MIVCTKCRCTKKDDDFYFRDKSKSKRFSWCKDCTLSQNKKWRSKNKEHLISYQRERCSDAVQKLKQKERSHRWYLHNKEYALKLSKEWKERNPGKAREIKRKWACVNLHKYAEWKKLNADRVRAHNRNRKSKLKASGSFTAEQIRALYKFQEGKCFYCEIGLNNKFHIDHYIPISKGGDNFIQNIRLACADCNLRKSNKLPNAIIERANPATQGASVQPGMGGTPQDVAAAPGSALAALTNTVGTT